MKKIILISAMLLITGSAFTQQKKPLSDAIRAGLNCAFFTSGDIYMPAVSIDYVHPLNEFMAISPRIINAYHNRVGYGNYKYSSSLAAALSLKLSLLPGIFDPLKIDIGALYHHFKTSTLYLADPNTSLSGNYDYYIEDHFGLIGSISLDFPAKRRIFWGGRFDMLTSFQGNYFNVDSFQGGIYCGLKF